MLDPFPNGCNSQSWADSKPAASLGPFSAAFLRLKRGLVGSGVPRIQTGCHVRCWHHRWRLSILRCQPLAKKNFFWLRLVKVQMRRGEPDPEILYRYGRGPGKGHVHFPGMERQSSRPLVDKFFWRFPVGRGRPYFSPTLCPDGFIWNVEQETAIHALVYSLNAWQQLEGKHQLHLTWWW